MFRLEKPVKKVEKSVNRLVGEPLSAYDEELKLAEALSASITSSQRFEISFQYVFWR